MAVIIKYVVERNGEEKMTFTSKKDADAYDKMLDIADLLVDFLAAAPLELAEQTREELALHLAQHKDEVQSLLKGSAPAAKPVKKKVAKRTTGIEPASE